MQTKEKLRRRMLFMAACGKTQSPVMWIFVKPALTETPHYYELFVPVIFIFWILVSFNEAKSQTLWGKYNNVSKCQQINLKDIKKIRPVFVFL